MSLEDPDIPKPLSTLVTGECPLVCIGNVSVQEPLRLEYLGALGAQKLFYTMCVCDMFLKE